ncbi:MAG: hypothetical protein ACXVHX_39170 [Solirubrobacteraceae bacterium]
MTSDPRSAVEACPIDAIAPEDQIAPYAPGPHRPRFAASRVVEVGVDGRRQAAEAVDNLIDRVPLSLTEVPASATAEALDCTVTPWLCRASAARHAAEILL